MVRKLNKSVMFSQTEHDEIKRLASELDLYIRQAVMLAVRDYLKKLK